MSSGSVGILGSTSGKRRRDGRSVVCPLSFVFCIWRRRLRIPSAEFEKRDEGTGFTTGLLSCPCPVCASAGARRSSDIGGLVSVILGIRDPGYP
jgi:hypothetical protein